MACNLRCKIKKSIYFTNLWWMHKAKPITGSEILLRWQHPAEGLIMPTDFIPIAKKGYLILEIGY